MSWQIVFYYFLTCPHYSIDCLIIYYLSFICFYDDGYITMKFMPCAWDFGGKLPAYKWQDITWIPIYWQYRHARYGLQLIVMKVVAVAINDLWQTGKCHDIHISVPKETKYFTYNLVNEIHLLWLKEIVVTK